jgi:hypothetical protein
MLNRIIFSRIDPCKKTGVTFIRLATFAMLLIFSVTQRVDTSDCAVRLYNPAFVCAVRMSAIEVCKILIRCRKILVFHWRTSLLVFALFPCMYFLHDGSLINNVGWGDVDWIDLAQDRDWWRAVVYTVMNLRVP